MERKEKILGVEGGGTKTAWVLVERTGAGGADSGSQLRILDQGRLPPSNVRLETPDRLRAIFCELPSEIDRAGIFLAGCGTAEDRQSLSRLCAEIWPNARIVSGSDRESGLAAGLGHGDGIVVSAGSGSSVTGRRGDRIENAGGWGHILGDTGGGYFLSIQALRLLLREYDLHRGEMQFTAKVLHALSLNNLDEVVRWVQTADKMEIAMLTPVVFEAAASGDARVTEIVENGAQALSEYTEAVASRLHLLAPKVVLLGGLFHRDSIYTHAFRRRLKKNLPDARVAIAECTPELGAAWLAAELNDHVVFQSKLPESEIDNLAAVLTEQRNPRSENLEELSPRALVELFVEEEKSVQDALRGAIADLARAIEGAEDEESGGALALDERGIKSSDVVIGITASGRTPFVLGALARSKSLGAKTILLTCNPSGSQKVIVDLAINLMVGPEVLTGSTRLKAGTATKIALNVISTAAMVALGKVRGNLMIDLHASNSKLRDRAIRLVAQLSGSDYNSARQQLEANDWNLRAVVDKIHQ